jgi:hypothetical protein
MNTKECDPKKPEESKDKDNSEEQPLTLRTVRPAIGEGRDNLRRRGAWFQQRNGTKS